MKSYAIKVLISLLFLLSLSSCDNEIVEPYHPYFEGGILFLGHTYQTNSTVDERVERLLLQNYEHIWLGGDVCAATTRDLSTLIYLDSLFNFRKPGNFWAIGNHDVNTTDNDHLFIEAATGRNEYYAEYMKGITGIKYYGSLS